MDETAYSSGGENILYKVVIGDGKWTFYNNLRFVHTLSCEPASNSTSRRDDQGHGISWGMLLWASRQYNLHCCTIQVVNLSRKIDWKWQPGTWLSATSQMTQVAPSKIHSFNYDVPLRMVVYNHFLPFRDIRLIIQRDKSINAFYLMSAIRLHT